jgi:hypothetical protein
LSAATISRVTDWNSAGSTVESFTTAVGIVVGGVWAYFKFIKDRIYRPRVNLTVEAGHVTVDGVRFLACRATIENKGASKLKVQDGTVLIVRTGSVGEGALLATHWSSNEDDATAMVKVFGKHEWLESTEIVCDDVMVRLEGSETTIYRVELRLLVGHPSWRSGNIAITSPLIVLPSQQWRPKEQGATP